MREDKPEFHRGYPAFESGVERPGLLSEARG